MIYAALPEDAVDYMLMSSLHVCHGTDGGLCAHVHPLAHKLHVRSQSHCKPLTFNVVKGRRVRKQYPFNEHHVWRADWWTGKKKCCGGINCKNTVLCYGSIINNTWHKNPPVFAPSCSTLHSFYNSFLVNNCYLTKVLTAASFSLFLTSCCKELVQRVWGRIVFQHSSVICLF